MSEPPGHAPTTSPNLRAKGERAPYQPRGCPCGCYPNGVDCAAGRPVPDVHDDCAGCGVLGFEELAEARRRGIHCAAGCVAQRLRSLDLLEHDAYELGADVPGHNFGGGAA